MEQADFDTDRGTFEEREAIDEGLGPVFNAQSCAECHQNPVTGAISQITELRAGHFDGVNFIDHPGGPLINDRAIDASIQERVLGGNEVRTFRTSLNTLGDGFVERLATSWATSTATERRISPCRSRRSRAVWTSSTTGSPTGGSRTRSRSRRRPRRSPRPR